MGKTLAGGWFIGCFIEIKHLAEVVGVLLEMGCLQLAGR